MSEQATPQTWADVEAAFPTWAALEEALSSPLEVEELTEDSDAVDD